jgi:hypothetical protein
MARRPEDVHVAAADFQDEEDVDPFTVTARSTWKKSTASMVEACAEGTVSVSYRCARMVPEVSAAA